MQASQADQVEKPMRLDILEERPVRNGFRLELLRYARLEREFDSISREVVCPW
jgi:hypothetical protein